MPFWSGGNKAGLKRLLWDSNKTVTAEKVYAVYLPAYIDCLAVHGKSLAVGELKL